MNSQGGCFCTAVRYEVSAEPIALFACHCTDCQTCSGSSFVLALRMPHGGVTVLRGEAKPYERADADGQKRNVFRCPQCLTALWSELPDSREYLTVYAGTLDNSSTLRPVAHIWTQDAQPWITLPEETLQFDENPPDLQPIVRAWRGQNEATAQPPNQRRRLILPVRQKTKR